MLALIVLGMGISTTVSFYKSKGALEEAITGQINQQVVSTLKVMASWLRDRKLDISSWSQQSVFGIALEDSFVGKAARKSANLQLEKFKGDYKHYENLFIANASGDTVASSDKSLIGNLKVTDHEAFKQAMKGNIYVSDVMKSTTVEAPPVFVISTPIMEKDIIIGAFMGVIEVNTFSQQFIDPIRVCDTGYAFIYDEGGSIIAHPDKSKILKIKMEEYDYGRNMMERGNGLFVYAHKGGENLVAFEKYEELGWTIGISAPTAELLAPVKMLSYMNLTVALTVVILGATLILLIVQTLVKPISRIVKNLTNAATHVSSGSDQVSTSSHSLAQGASEHAAAIEETSSSMEEMSSMIRQNADNATQADSLMRNTQQVVNGANESMGELTTSMNEISKASEDTSKIIKTIDEIAFQTNLLALNAAVEAARAGEAGTGFAVVADEVRNLALRAADAASNTANLIEETKTKVSEGTVLVSKTNEAFSQVAESSTKVGELLKEIAAASSEQAHGIELVNKNVAEMDKVVQGVAASAEESASASEEMNAQAGHMKDMVNELVDLVGENGIRTVRTSVSELKDSDSGFHQAIPVPIRTAKSEEISVSRAKVVKPEHVIPIDESFKDF